MYDIKLCVCFHRQRIPAVFWRISCAGILREITWRRRWMKRDRLLYVAPWASAWRSRGTCGWRPGTRPKPLRPADRRDCLTTPKRLRRSERRERTRSFQATQTWSFCLYLLALTRVPWFPQSSQSERRPAGSGSGGEWQVEFSKRWRLFLSFSRLSRPRGEAAGFTLLCFARWQSCVCSADRTVKTFPAAHCICDHYTYK